MGEIRATPQNKALAQLAQLLRSGRELGDKVEIPLLGGLGSMFLGKYPEEIEEWSYGNAPMQMTPMGDRLPKMKAGRGQQVADTLFAVADLGAARSLASALAKPMTKALENSAPVKLALELQEARAPVSRVLQVNPEVEYQRSQRILQDKTPGYVELFNKEDLRKTPGNRYAQVYPRDEDDPEVEALTGVLKIIQGRLKDSQKYALARGSRASQFSINPFEGEAGVNYLPRHFFESQGWGKDFADMPVNLVSHARGTMLPSGKFLLEEAQSDWWRDVARMRQLGLTPVTPQGAQKAWPRELMKELSQYVKSEGGDSILVPDSLTKYVTNYGHLESPPKESQLALGALRLYPEGLTRGLKTSEVRLKDLPLDDQVRQLLGDELTFREVQLKAEGGQVKLQDDAPPWPWMPYNKSGPISKVS